MASKADFQNLADWCQLLNPPPQTKRVVSAKLIRVSPPKSDDLSAYHYYSGYLNFKPGGSPSNLHPDHYNGQLIYDHPSVPTSFVTLAMAVGDDYTTADFIWTFSGVWDVLQVE